MPFIAPVHSSEIPRTQILNIGNVPGAATASRSQFGDPRDCEMSALSSTETIVDLQPKYGWPNKAGKSLLTKVGAKLTYRLDQVLDYTLPKGETTDTASSEFCQGTRTEKTTVRIGTKNGEHTIFRLKILNNDAASVGYNFKESVANQCEQKNNPKTLKVRVDDLIRFRQPNGEIASKTRTTKQSVTCKTNQYAESTPTLSPLTP